MHRDCSISGETLTRANRALALRRAAALAEDVTTANRWQILAVARELRARGRLSGAKVVRVVSGSMR